MDETRQRCRNVISSRLSKVIVNTTDYTNEKLLDILATEIDKGIVNYMIDKNVVKFEKGVYTERLRTVLWNLTNKANPGLLERVLSRDISIKHLCQTMTHREMFAERYTQADAELQQEFEHLHGIIELEDRPDGMLVCGKCKSKKTSYYELQTRSGDEPMTVFAQCFKCKNHWRQ